MERNNITKHTEELARLGVDGVLRPLDGQQADKRQEQAGHIAHDVVAMDVAQPGQGGVYEQRDGETYDGRHETGQYEEVLPAASRLRDRGRRSGV